MRVLITGAGGFVASHLREALLRVCGSDIELIATAKDAGTHPVYGKTGALDVTDRAAVRAALRSHIPSHVIHLAGIAAPSVSNADARMTWQVHLDGALNLADAILAENPNCCLLHVGSALVYGESTKSGVAVDEATLLAPIDEYGASKGAADLALGALAHRGLKCVRLRPFNHSGPGQAEGFVVPDFAAQIARIEAGVSPPIIRVGNLDVERDFLDVRDVVEAYALALQRAASLERGIIFNIASGVPRRVGDVLERLLGASPAKITLKQDPARLRPTEYPCVVGNSARARQSLAWSPHRRFEDTVIEVLNDWRARVAKSSLA